MNPSGEALFERYHTRVYLYFRRVTGRHDVAEDLTQDLFLRLLSGWRSYQGLGHETEWVFRSARNLALDYQRKQAITLQARWQDAAGAATDAPQVVAFGLAEALALLNETDRHALLLREVVGLSYQELAVACQMTPGTLSQRLCRARRRLRKLLGSRAVAGDRERDGEDG